MRLAFVSIPRFPCAVEALQDPRLARRPLIVGDADQPRRVLDCSLDAERRGVRHDMPIRKALALCPDAAVLPPDIVLYRARWEGILDALYDVSPEIEEDELGRAYINVGGLLAHYRDERTLASHLLEVVRSASGFTASVGLATGKFPAFAAATTGADGPVVVPAGGEGDFLAPLPLELLPVDREVLRRLELYGLETVGEVARLTLPELQSQFGFEGRRLFQLVRGIDETPFLPRRPVEKVEAGISFDAPVAGVDVMVAASKQLLSRLRLQLKGRAARELILQAELASERGWERRLVLREAVSESERLAFILRSSLQNAPPPNAVRSLSLRLSGLTGETGRQLSFGERSRLQQQLEEALRQLKARYGYSPVYHCVDVEPWSSIPEERQILVEYDA